MDEASNLTVEKWRSRMNGCIRMYADRERFVSAIMRGELRVNSASGVEDNIKGTALVMVTLRIRERGIPKVMMICGLTRLDRWIWPKISVKECGGD